MKYFGGVPGGLVAIAVGTIIAWVSNMFGLGYGGLTVAKMLGSVSNFGFSYPLPAFLHILAGFKYFCIILVTAIPFGIYDLIEALDNVESAAAIGDAKLAQVGVLYKGLETTGGGATLAGIILDAITVFIIDREFEKAAAFAMAGTIFMFFGFIHGEAIGIGSSPAVAGSYLEVAVILFALSKYAEFHPLPTEMHQPAEAD